MCVDERPTAIIVEDDEALRSALSFALRLDNLRVIGLASGEALLNLPLPTGRACLVLDHVLQGISGLDALARLRASGADLPTILITTNPGSAIRDRAKSLNAAIVEKPLLGDTLASAIRSALQVKF